MRERSDEQLMLSYGAGDAGAFELLYERYRGPLYRYILRRVGDAATANDLYQGAWEKIIRARQSYSAAAPFRAWMFRIAGNHVTDHFRRSRPMSEAGLDQLESGHSEPGLDIDERMRMEDLLEGIAQLPPEQKDVLMLKLEAGLDLRSIADVTGVNRETAKSRLRYAVNKLRRRLGE
jgi:RNA polymerase sigma-70 factor (ECF subfamily)